MFSKAQVVVLTVIGVVAPTAFFLVFLGSRSFLTADHELTLDQAASGTNTDKFTNGHLYQRFYVGVFAPFLKLPIRLLEIGVRDGSSLRAWSRYFSQYEHIYGLAYGEPGKEAHDKHVSELDRVTVYSGDQSDSQTLDLLLRKSGGSFDIVIDDGSHVPWHILFSFYTLFPAVKPGGLYIVEDVETSYWNVPGVDIYGYLLNNTGTGQGGNVVDFFSDLTHVINGRVQALPELRLFSKMEHEISSIQFAENCVILQKGLDSSYRSRPYEHTAAIDVQAAKQWLSEKMVRYHMAFPQLSHIEQLHRNYIPFAGADTLGRY